MTSADLISWRRRLGWTQREAAEKLEVPLATYTNWEQERRGISGLVELACRLLEEKHQTNNRRET